MATLKEAAIKKFDECLAQLDPLSEQCAEAKREFNDRVTRLHAAHAADMSLNELGTS